MSEMSTSLIMIIHQFPDLSDDVNNLNLQTKTQWSFINPDTRTKQPRLQPTVHLPSNRFQRGSLVILADPDSDCGNRLPACPEEDRWFGRCKLAPALWV